MLEVQCFGVGQGSWFWGARVDAQSSIWLNGQKPQLNGAFNM
jgi:hypothetical protein